MKNKLKSILKLLILSLFLAYWSGISMFFHRHEFDGRSFFHSHPYWPVSDHHHSNHQHSGDQLLTIGFLSLFLALSAAVAVQMLIKKPYFTYQFLHLTDEYKQNQLAPAFMLRAPPQTS